MSNVDRETPYLFDLPRPTTNWTPPESLPSLDGIQRVWVDTESDGLDPRKSKVIGDSFVLPNGKRYYLPFRHGGGGNLDEGLWRRWHERELRGKDLVFLNAKHDWHMYRNTGIDLEKQGCRLHDVSFKAALLDDNRRSGLDLDSLHKEYCKGKGKTKLDRTIDKAKMIETHSSEVGEYAEDDAQLVKEIDQATDPLIAKEDLGRVLKLEDDLIYCTASMEHAGIPLNMDKLARWDKELQEEYGKEILEIWRQVKFRVNPDSPTDMAQLFRSLGLESPDKTGGGDESFTAYAITKLNHPVLNRALRARRLASLRSKYVHKFLRVARNGHFYFSLHQLKGDDYGTISGRYSGTDGCQQIMKVDRQVEKMGPDYIIRELCEPAPGKVWGSADAKQIEFRLMVHYSRSQRLIKMYEQNPNIDFHDIATGFLTKSPSFASMPFKNARRRGKILSFGIVYGLSSVDTAAEQLECSREEAAEAMADYDEALPEPRRLLRQCTNVADTRGYVKTILNRRGRFPDKKGMHRAFSRVGQGSAADINKLKLLEFYNNRELLGIDPMRLTLHDEINADVDPDPKYINRWQEVLDSQSVPLDVPILWEVKFGKNWAECK
jgi:DNA polymerase-1